VQIPDELRDAMRSAREIIEQAEYDSDVNLDYGDAIQVPRVCGGRIGSGKRPFVFTYFPTNDEQRGRWYLKLHPLEIEDIANGRMTEIPMYCCTSPDCRSKFREPNETCIVCDYVEDMHYGRFTLPEALSRLEELGLRGLTPASTRTDVQRILGEPASTGGGVDLPSVGYIRPWIKYSLPTVHLHFELEPDGAIRMVTLEPID
jgi:hypothetical protein